MHVFLTASFLVNNLCQEKQRAVDVLALPDPLTLLGPRSEGRDASGRSLMYTRLLTASQIHKSKHTAVRLLLLLPPHTVNSQPVQCVTPRRLVVHLRLRVTSVLLSKFQQIQTLLETLHWNLNQASN